MNTKRIRIRDKKNIDDRELSEAARILTEGGLVAFPTETVYGLGANALDPAAAKKIYAAKGRPSDNPLIAHIADMAGLTPLVAEIPDTARKLSKAFWPGPLTMVFQKSGIVPYETTGGLETVAVRMPGDPVARRLIELAGIPVAAPSANTSGRPSPTMAEHVWEDMNGKIDILLDGGPVGIGLESTIVDVSGEVPVLLRPGAVTVEMLKDVIGDIEIDPGITGRPAADIRPKAPGMKYRHYAPQARLLLVQGELEAVVGAINRLVQEQQEHGLKAGIICTDETRERYRQGTVRCIGSREQEEAIAHNLFAVLREFDSLQVDVIYSECFPMDHLGQAIMNRLMKAAGYAVIKV